MEPLDVFEFCTYAEDRVGIRTEDIRLVTVQLLFRLSRRILPFLRREVRQLQLRAFAAFLLHRCGYFAAEIDPETFAATAFAVISREPSVWRKE